MTIEAIYIEALDQPCDRCGKVADVTRPFKLAEKITYRRKVIERAWLCRRCFVIEKDKFWKARSR